MMYDGPVSPTYAIINGLPLNFVPRGMAGMGRGTGNLRLLDLKLHIANLQIKRLKPVADLHGKILAPIFLHFHAFLMK